MSSWFIQSSFSFNIGHFPTFLMWLIQVCLERYFCRCITLLGPLLTSLMHLVSRMPMNHLYANLQVTRLVTHLLALPLPLVRLQLLPPTAQEVTSLDDRWLYTTLMAVRQWFDCFINLHFSSALSTSPSSGASFVGFLEALRVAVFQPPRCPAIGSHVPSASSELDI